MLGVLFGFLLTRLDWVGEPSVRSRHSGLARAELGIFLILTLVYFSFSAPAVIARWTEGNYALIVIAVSLLAALWAWLALLRPSLLEHLTRDGLRLWNLAFALSLVGTILVHRVPFPTTPASLFGR